VAGQGLQRPLILLKDGKNNIRLRLRKVSFLRELEELPSNQKALVELLVQSQARINGGIYETVVIWSKLNQYDKYWTNFEPRFSTEAQFLAHYNLPDGAMLHHWKVMVEVFDKATFILLGENAMMYMMRQIDQYQDNVDEKKRDYAAILATYSRTHDNFDRLAFFDGVRRYVIEKYEKPQAKAAGVQHKVWLQQKAKQANGKATRVKVVDAPKGQTVQPRVQSDFAWKQDECHYCSVKTDIIRDFIRYTQQLEAFAKAHAGEDQLPEKPESLKSLENLQ
jgi:hypothetical protein